MVVIILQIAIVKIVHTPSGHSVILGRENVTLSAIFEYYDAIAICARAQPSVQD